MCVFFQVQESNAKEGLEKANRNAMNLVKTYWISVCSTGLYFMIAPVLKIVWSRIHQTQVMLELPMPMR